MNNLKFLLLGTGLSFIPLTINAQCVATQDCATLGYTETSCNGSKGVKCPFGSGWFCAGDEASICDKNGFKYTCTGTGYSGGSGESCGGKYKTCTCTTGYTWNGSSCGCASGYEWNGSACVIACNYTVTAEYCAQSCKNTSGSPCYKGNVAYYPGCGGSTCSGKCIDGTCLTGHGSGRCCNPNCDNYDRCMEIIRYSCAYEENFCKTYYDKGYFVQTYECRISHPNPDADNSDKYDCYYKR